MNEEDLPIDWVTCRPKLTPAMLACIASAHPNASTDPKAAVTSAIALYIEAADRIEEASSRAQFVQRFNEHPQEIEKALLKAKVELPKPNQPWEKAMAITRFLKAATGTDNYDTGWKRLSEAIESSRLYEWEGKYSCTEEMEVALKKDGVTSREMFILLASALHLPNLDVAMLQTKTVEFL